MRCSFAGNYYLAPTLSSLYIPLPTCGTCVLQPSVASGCGGTRMVVPGCAADPSVGTQAGSASSSSASLRGYSGSRSAHTPTAASPWQPLVLAGMGNRRLYTARIYSSMRPLVYGHFIGVCLSTSNLTVRRSNAPGGASFLLSSFWRAKLSCTLLDYKKTHFLHFSGGARFLDRHGRSANGCYQGSIAWLLGGHVWFARGGMHGCSGGVCVVASGGHAWLLGGQAWLLGGEYMVARGHALVYP